MAVSLVAAGVPWELARNMDRVDMQAWMIALGENQGRRFNYDAWEWARE